MSAHAIQGWSAVNDMSGCSAQRIDSASQTMNTATSSSRRRGTCLPWSWAWLRSVPSHASAITSPAACEAVSKPGSPVRNVVGTQSAMPSGRFTSTSGR